MGLFVLFLYNAINCTQTRTAICYGIITCVFRDITYQHQYGVWRQSIEILIFYLFNPRFNLQVSLFIVFNESIFSYLNKYSVNVFSTPDFLNVVLIICRWELVASLYGKKTVWTIKIFYDISRDIYISENKLKLALL